MLDWFSNLEQKASIHSALLHYNFICSFSVPNLTVFQRPFFNSGIICLVINLDKIYSTASRFAIYTSLPFHHFVWAFHWVFIFDEKISDSCHFIFYSFFTKIQILFQLTFSKIKIASFSNLVLVCRSNFLAKKSNPNASFSIKFAYSSTSLFSLDACPTYFRVIFDCTAISSTHFADSSLLSISLVAYSSFIFLDAKIFPKLKVILFEVIWFAIV